MNTIMYKEVNVSQTLPLTLNGVLVTKHMLEHDVFVFFFAISNHLWLHICFSC